MLKMKLMLITLVAVVVGMMVACSSAPAAPSAPAKPAATLPPAFSDDEVIGALRQHLMSPGMDYYCGILSRNIRGLGLEVRQDRSNRDKYLVTSSVGDEALSWTFVGSLAKIIPTSKDGRAEFYGC